MAAKADFSISADEIDTLTYCGYREVGQGEAHEDGGRPLVELTLSLDLREGPLQPACCLWVA